MLRFGRFLQHLENDPGLASNLAVIVIERDNGIHSPQREQQRMPSGIRSRAARHAAVAALGDNRHAMFAAQPDQRRQFRRVSRARHRTGLAVIAPAPIGQPRCSQVRIGRHSARAKQRGDFIKKELIAVHDAGYCTSPGKAKLCKSKRAG